MSLVVYCHRVVRTRGIQGITPYRVGMSSCTVHRTSDTHAPLFGGCRVVQPPKDLEGRACGLAVLWHPWAPLAWLGVEVPGWLAHHLPGLRCCILEALGGTASSFLERQKAKCYNPQHAKNTIKGCVLRSWAWEQFPPTLLQHESPGYCNCSPCGCPAEDARQNRGKKGNRSVA